MDKKTKRSAENPSLCQVLDSLHDHVDKNDHKVTLGDIVNALKKRGFAALLIFPAVVAISPLGALPGVPLICALLIALVTLQVVFGSTRIWLPKKLKDVSFSKSRVLKTVQSARPAAAKIDKVVECRLEFFHHPILQRAVALLCLALSVPMAVVGFIPFLPALLSVPILLFAAGMLIKDGLLTAIGFAVSAGVMFLIPYMTSVIG